MIPLVAEHQAEYAAALCEEYGFRLTDTAEGLTLKLTDSRLELIDTEQPKQGAVYVDFVSGASAHRRKFGGGKGQSIAKAVGMNKGVTPSVLDATAGLGRDAFVLASLGATVTLLERHPVAHALLSDGLKRAAADEEIGTMIRQHMQLAPRGSLLDGYTPQQDIDVVYLDPMFPHRENSAKVKKEMRVFQSLVGADLDADGLLDKAWNIASKRVVVKRPDYAPNLAERVPNSRIESKKNRYDLYIKAAMK